MLTEAFEPALDQIEAQLSGVVEAVGAGNAAQLEAASTRLQQLSLDLARLVEGRPQADLARVQGRLRRIADLIAGQRAGLIRQAAHVERTLGVLLPSAKPAITYGKPVGARRFLA